MNSSQHRTHSPFLASPTSSTSAAGLDWSLLGAVCIHCLTVVTQHTHRAGLCRMEFFLTGSGDQALPFELQAFEVPLAAAVRMFESETSALEDKLLPSLERLTAKVTLLFTST